MSLESTEIPHTPPRPTDVQTTPQQVGVIAIIVASLIGSICLILADILKNPVTATTVLAKYAQIRLPHMGIALLELVAIVLVMLIGLGLCFVFRPQTLPGAFGRSSGLHAVLFGINTFGGLAGPVMAQTIWTPGPDAKPIIYTLETPETYGPLGLGTKITGRSSAQVHQILATTPIEIDDCLQIEPVGDGLFCSILRRDAEIILGVELPGARSPVWVQINSAGWSRN